MLSHVLAAGGIRVMWVLSLLKVGCHGPCPLSVSWRLSSVPSAWRVCSDSVDVMRPMLIRVLGDNKESLGCRGLVICSIGIQVHGCPASASSCRRCLLLGEYRRAQWWTAVVSLSCSRQGFVITYYSLPP